MATIKLMESTLGGNFELQISEMTGGNVVFPAQFIDKLSEILLLGMADYAKTLRNKDKAVAVAIDNEAGQIDMWLKLEWMPGTEDDPDGSWNPTWGFGAEAEELGDATIYRCSNNTDLITATKNRGAARRIEFPEPLHIITAFRCFAKTLKAWLDTNAKVEEEVALVHDNYFKASVNVINDEKVFTFSSEEELTNIMKGDGSLQVNP